MKVPRLSLLPNELKNGAGIIKQYSVEETYPIHTHDFFELVFIVKGKGIHCINVERNTVVVVFARTVSCNVDIAFFIVHKHIINELR